MYNVIFRVTWLYSTSDIMVPQLSLLIPSQWEGLQCLLQEDEEEDEHQVLVNTTNNTYFVDKSYLLRPPPSCNPTNVHYPPPLHNDSAPV